MICSRNKLQEEIHQTKEILSYNEHPKDITSKHICNKISHFSKPSVFGPDKCTVYLRSPFIGSASLLLEKKVKTAVKIAIVP